MPVIEAPPALFEVQVEGHHGHATELLKPSLGEAPEALYPVDMALAIGELVRAMMGSEVFRMADIHQAVVAAPAVRMDDRVGRDSAADNGL